MAKPQRPLLTLSLAAWLFACGQQPAPSSNQEAMQLIPLSPYHHEFSTPAGKSRNDYFLVAAGHRNDADFRLTLRQRVEAAKPQDAAEYALYSIYVYEKSDKLDETFSGDSEAVRGVYDDFLLAYARWNENRLDIFYLIKDGNVVFDVLKDEPISPSWEFD